MFPLLKRTTRSYVCCDVDWCRMEHFVKERRVWYLEQLLGVEVQQNWYRSTLQSFETQQLNYIRLDIYSGLLKTWSRELQRLLFIPTPTGNVITETADERSKKKPLWGSLLLGQRVNVPECSSASKFLREKTAEQRNSSTRKTVKDGDLVLVVTEFPVWNRKVLHHSFDVPIVWSYGTPGGRRGPNCQARFPPDQRVRYCTLTKSRDLRNLPGATIRTVYHPRNVVVIAKWFLPFA